MKIPLALQPHSPASFCLIFTRSLSADGKKGLRTILRAQRPAGKPGRVSGLWAEGFFLLDLLVTFGSSQK
jgi:hypothetical protein